MPILVSSLELVATSGVLSSAIVGAAMKTSGRNTIVPSTKRLCR